MASAASDTPSTPGARHTECPVCFQPFVVPKMLQCGHSICEGCVDRLKVGLAVLQVDCPICRFKTTIRSGGGGLPTNYALLSLIDEQKQETGKYFHCAQPNCARKDHPVDDMWRCIGCNFFACANCVVRSHRDHEVQPMKTLLELRNRDLTTWNGEMSNLSRDMKRGQAELKRNVGKCKERAFETFTLLNTKLIPALTATIHETNDEIDSLNETVRNADVGNLTSTGRYESHMTEVPEKFRVLKQRQDQAKANVRVLDDVTQNTLDILTECLTRFRETTNEAAAAEGAVGFDIASGDSTEEISSAEACVIPEQVQVASNALPSLRGLELDDGDTIYISTDTDSIGSNTLPAVFANRLFGMDASDGQSAFGHPSEWTLQWLNGGGQRTAANQGNGAAPRPCNVTANNRHIGGIGRGTPVSPPVNVSSSPPGFMSRRGRGRGSTAPFVGVRPPGLPPRVAVRGAYPATSSSTTRGPSLGLDGTTDAEEESGW